MTIGLHILLNLHDCTIFPNSTVTQKSLKNIAEHCGATVLQTYGHQFPGGNGITAGVILAESHITIHTWPEKKYVAADVFMCGQCRPKDAIPLIVNIFGAKKFDQKAINR